MPQENLIQDKSIELAFSIVKLYKILVNDQKEFILSKQILKSGTSVGANVQEALNGESKADFIHKLSIAQKECAETRYWLMVLNEGDFISKDNYLNLLDLTTRNLKIIRSIILSTKANLKAKPNP